MTSARFKLAGRLLAIGLTAAAAVSLIVPLSAAGTARLAGGWLLFWPLIPYLGAWAFVEIVAVGRYGELKSDSLRLAMIGLVSGGLILLVADAAALAQAYGLASGATKDWTNRAVMIAAGLFFALLGDQGAKTPAPLRDNPNRMRAFQQYYRSYGWVWVLLGLAMAVSAFLIPVDRIPTAMVLASVIGVLTSLYLCRRLIRARSA